jgi:DNA (cytosine-5)-methyltransferase 1
MASRKNPNPSGHRARSSTARKASSTTSVSSPSSEVVDKSKKEEEDADKRSPAKLARLSVNERPGIDFVGSHANQPAFSFIDLFAGIGGLRRGFENVGGRCVFTSEWDRWAQITYKANYVVDHDIAGDITQVDAGDVPDHDLLLAGFPCQPFSLAGVSKKNSLGRKHGFDCDTQGTLFFDVERIIAEKRPRAIVLENVKHLMRHDGGYTWRVIETVLRKKLGYVIHPLVIDARHLLPQHRERIFIVGFDRETSFSWNDLVLPRKEDGPTLETVLHPEDGSEARVDGDRFLDKQGRVLSRFVLSDHLWRYLRDYADKHKARGNGFGYGLVGPAQVARTLSARYHKDGSEILVKRRSGNPRRLTPRECARLMGFDDLIGRTSRSEPFVLPSSVSDTQLYRQFGNSVAVPVVQHIARLMLPHLNGTAAPPEQLTFALAGAR